MKIIVKDVNKFLGIIFLIMLIVLMYSFFEFSVLETFKKFLIWFGIVVIFSAIFTYLSFIVKEKE